MRRTTTAAIVAVSAATLFVTGTALAAPSADGVFFVHGTGDNTKPSTQVNPTNGTAVTGYWTQTSINQMVTSPAGGKWTYGVAGYQGASQAAWDAAYDVATQIHDFKNANTLVKNIVLVTHSNGSNPIRYMMAHPTYTDAYGTSYGTILGWVKRVVFIAGDNTGTPLADKVTTSNSVANISNSILTFFGGPNFNNPAVRQQIQANMATYNSNGTFATGTSPGGIPTYFLSGNTVYATVWSADANCGGYTITTGLKAAQLYGWGTTSSATSSDGFLGWNTYYGDSAHYSTKYVGTNGMPGGVGDDRLNHNQSRRACHGIASTLTSTIHGALSGTFSLPSDYTVSPSAQACNETLRGWDTAAPDPGQVFYYGCTSAMRTDGVTDFNCQISYGGDNGDNFTFLNGLTTSVTTTSPDGTITTTPDVPVSDAYATSWYGNTSLVDCSDSWLGDGTCDMCLVAKYGFDAQPGSTNADDCVIQPRITQSCTLDDGTSCHQDSDCASGTCDVWVGQCVTAGTTPCSAYGPFYACHLGTCHPMNECSDLYWYDPNATDTPTYTPSATDTSTMFDSSTSTAGIGYFHFAAGH
jgi:hypothetical protein